MPRTLRRPPNENTSLNHALAQKRFMMDGITRSVARPVSTGNLTCYEFVSGWLRIGPDEASQPPPCIELA